MKERRGHQRRQVSWAVRVWLGDGVFAVARAVDVSPGGMRLTISPRAQAMIHPDQTYNVEVELAPAPLTCLAEVRHQDDGVGLAFKKPLPGLADILSPAETAATVA